MRKIEKEMNSAIRSRENWCKINTQVSVDEEDTVSVHLHGHLIAIIGPQYIVLKDAGWQTKLTKSRLNAICQEFLPTTGITQKNGEWHLKTNHGSMPWTGIKTLFRGREAELTDKDIRRD